jgi:hypothetical protein
MLEWARCYFHKKRTGTHYAKLMFLHLVGSTGHVVHSCAPEAQNVITLFFMLRWDWYGFEKKYAGTCYVELAFFNLVKYVRHVVHFGASEV